MGVIADGCLAPGSSAIVGNAVELNFSEGEFETPRIVGLNKPVNQFVLGAVNSAAWGVAGNGYGNVIGGAFEESLGKKAGSITSEVFSGVPADAAEEGFESTFIEQVK